MTRRGRSLTRALLVALLCAASFHFAIPARAETFTVCPSGCDATTIAAALRDADNGDTIAIGEGTYAGGVVVSQDVTLRGAGRDRTTIQGTSAASVIRVSASAEVTIQAVTITGGGGSKTRTDGIGGGGILNEGELVLRDSIVRANTVTTGLGGGIYSASSKPLEIRDSEVSGNTATDGGGLYLRGDDVEIEDTTVSGNRSTRHGGGIVHHGETLRLEHSDISGNQAGMDVGGAITSAELVLVDSTVTGNSAVNVGGLAGGREVLQILRSTIRGNISRGSGGGLRVGSGGVELVNSTVEKNESRGASGGGIFASNLSGDVSLRNSTLSGNTAVQDGGGILNDRSKIDLDNSKMIDNQAGRLGGGDLLPDQQPELDQDSATGASSPAIGPTSVTR